MQSSDLERQTSFGKSHRSSAESRIPKPNTSLKKATKSFGSGIPRPSLEKARSISGDLKTARTGSTSLSDSIEKGGSTADRVLVTVRLRPLSERERSRGDREVWESLDEHTIGVKGDSQGPKIKFAFDTVFDGSSTNKQVYHKAAGNIVNAAMDGLNATVFAYGVTSSGKTYTMMGSPDDPGIVQRAIRDVFKAIQHTPERDFLLRFSMMEIYNEVLNDLLDPARANLKLREDPNKGFFVENIKEETLVSAEHALSVIAAGDAHRKVSATAFNEGSSRSHTIMRLSIESSERPGPDADPRVHVARTLSFLNLIDLAGSESAKANINNSKGQAREGSFINKSLLTLGTVIGKLSDGNAVHIPFRDSKLTRLLQSSMTGSAARISVIATATPASIQAEETHNTLKFAARAKKIELHAQRNEILDQSSLIMRYQAEIALLRRQLEDAAQGKGVAYVDPLHPEVRNLRERLEEEHQALLQREQDKATLEVRIARLTRIILHSTRVARPTHMYGQRYRQLLLSESQINCESPLVGYRKPHISAPSASFSATSENSRSTETRSSETLTEQSIPRTPSSQMRALQPLPLEISDGESQGNGVSGGLLTPSRDSYLDVPPWDRLPDVAGTVASIRSAGDLFAGSGLLNQLHTRLADENGHHEDPDTQLLKEQMSVIVDELDRKEAALEALQKNDSSDHVDVELQIMAAERDFLETKFKRAASRQEELIGHIQVLRRQLLSAGLRPEVAAARLISSDQPNSATEESIDAPDEKIKESAPDRQPSLRLDSSGRLGSSGPHSNLMSSEENNLVAEAHSQEVGKLQKKMGELEKALEGARVQVTQREVELKAERSKTETANDREQRKDAQLREVSKEVLQLRNEMSRMESLNNNLQGYGLDNMNDKALSDLVNQMTQAISRVRVTMQMRQIAGPMAQTSVPAQSQNLHIEASARPDGLPRTEAMLRKHSAEGTIQGIPLNSLPPAVAKDFRPFHYSPMTGSVPSLAKALSGTAELDTPGLYRESLTRR